MSFAVPEHVPSTPCVASTDAETGYGGQDEGQPARRSYSERSRGLRGDE
jgi:hypothetical protein